ncbi:hypothetical protein [Streptomyces sp. NPDC056660]|uniref:hypothetical protein n=1 Tax=Streptomyces sp. NPDC056660 TaxID=3345897 RepID=UPI0036C048E4
MKTDFLPQLSKDRVIAVVRAPEIPDAAALCAALRAGRIRWIEFTRTTPSLASHLRRAVADDTEDTNGIGAGTVMTAAQAAELIDAGNAARFLAAGARAVCAGSQVVPPAVVAAGDWPEIIRRARDFTEALTGRWSSGPRDLLAACPTMCPPPSCPRQPSQPGRTSPDS